MLLIPEFHPMNFMLLSRRLLDVLGIIVLAFLYFGLARLVLHFLTFGGNANLTLIWPSGGLALAILVLGGYRYGIGVFLGSLLSEYGVNGEWGTSVMIASGDTVELLIGVWLLNYDGRFDSMLTRPIDYLRLGIVSILCTCFDALIVMSSLLLNGRLKEAAYLIDMAYWWGSDLLGILVVTPFVLIWRKLPSDSLIFQRTFEVVICFTLSFFVGQIVFLDWFHGTPIALHAKGFWMFAFLTWTALRFGRHGITLFIMMVTIQALLGATLQVGYFAKDLNEIGLINISLYLFELTIVGCTLALSIAALKDALKQREQYEAFFNLTRDLQCFVSREGVLKQVNPSFIEVLGFSKEEVADKSVLEFIYPDDRENTRQAIEHFFEGGKSILDLESRCLCKDQSIRWLSWKAFHNHHENLFYASARDITESKRIQRSQLFMILDSIPDASLLVSDDGRIQYANNAAINLFGYLADELQGQLVDVLLPEDIRENPVNSREVFWRTTYPRPIGTVNPLPALRKDRSQFIIEIGLTPLQISAETLVLVTMVDITERQRLERELQITATVYKAIGEAIMVADADNRIVAVNPAFTQLTGYGEFEAIGQSTSLLKSGYHDQTFYQEMWLSLERTGHWQGEIYNRRKDGSIYLEWLVISTIYDEHNKVLQRLGIFSEVTDQKRTQQAIWQQANFDPLTGLPNRRLFHDRLQMEMKKNLRNGRALALMLLDLDHFKSINDTLGHHFGDELLKEASQRLSTCVRESDTVSRMGGDEFTVILAELNTLEVIDRVAENITHKLAEPFQLGDQVGLIATSIGIAIYPEHGESVEELLKHADQAMYQAKSKGGNGFCYFKS